MRAAPPTALAAVAAAATPVVAAALVSIAVLAWACEPGSTGGRLPPPNAGPVASAAATASPSPAAAAWPSAWRLVIVDDPTVEPRARAVGPDTGGGPGTGTAIALPAGAPALAALAVAADGAVAAVAPDGRAWTLRGAGDLFVADPPWRDLGPIVPPAGLPGPVLGATWSATSDTLLAVSGAPGSGRRRTVVVAAGQGGTAPRGVEVPLEADGPGLAALPGGQVAFIVRNLDDRGALARLAPAGSFVTLPVAARWVAAGGDVFVIVADAGVRAGSLEELRGGALPIERLPLEGPGDIGAVAVAGDGSLVAVVRLDDDGEPDRVDVVARDGSSWAAAGAVPFDDAPESAIVAWVRAP